MRTGERHLVAWLLLQALAGCAAPPARAPDQAEAAAEGSEEATEADAVAEPAADPSDDPSAGDPSAGTPANGATGAIQLDRDDGLDADIAALSASTAAAKPTSEAAPDESAGREIVYRVTAKGLVVELDGIHLRPEAKPFKDKNGAYGIELTLAAESFDRRQYWVNEPAEGPLSIAGKIESKDGKSARFVDERKGGDEEEVVMEGAPRTFRQRWPGRGQPKLWWGQTVTLEVGLWGVRAEGSRARPVRRLFVVKMVGGNKPQAVISPPTLDWGS